MATLEYIIYRSRTNLLKNLGKNGFDVTPYENADIRTIQEMYQNKNPNLLNMILHKNDASKSRAFVQYFIHSGSPQKPISAFKNNNLYDIIDNHRARTDYDGGPFVLETDVIVIVIPNEVNDTVQKMITQVWEDSQVFVVVFSLAELQYCVQDHNLVPKHIPLSEDEKAAVYERYFIVKDSNLPEISRFDPVAKAVLLRPNQLCKILRPSQTVIVENHFYRLCV